jgi:dihydrofolate reductase
MRKIILQLAVSLDGFIEGRNGEYDWCFTDQDYGMADYLKSVDSLFLGRRSYELMLEMGDEAMQGFSQLNEYVFSTTLQEVRPGAILIKDNVEAEVLRIKKQPGKDIWLFGGAGLTTTLMNLGLVDEIRLAVHPLILGSGKPLFQDLHKKIPLTLTDTKTYSSGLVMLTYNLS